MEKLENLGTYGVGPLPHEFRQHMGLTCPFCGGGDAAEKSFNINILDNFSALYKCHRELKCGEQGQVNIIQELVALRADATSLPTFGASSGSRKDKAKGTSRPAPSSLPVPKIDVELCHLSRDLLKFFEDRGISQETLQKSGVMQAVKVKNAVTKESVDAIAFPYKKEKEGPIVNVKFRQLPKTFWQVKGGQQVLYGVHQWEPGQTLVIVEGEMDKLAVDEALAQVGRKRSKGTQGNSEKNRKGLKEQFCVVSVPNGAVNELKKGELPSVENDRKFSYIHTCFDDVLKKCRKVILFTDNDGAGQALQEELCRRIGKFKCWRVDWPQAPGTAQGAPDIQSEGHADKTRDYRKDANEVLMKDGAEALVSYLETAQPYKLRGLYRFNDFREEILAFYHNSSGYEGGVTTGWPQLDEIYKVVPGELTVVTGVPNSGKSEFLDALVVNLARQHGWSFAFCSMEKKLTDHGIQLIEKYKEMPARHTHGRMRMTQKDFEDGMLWLDDRFCVIRMNEDSDDVPTIDWVLERAKVAVLRHGIRGLIIDPYNELDNGRGKEDRETEAVCHMLTKTKRFAQMRAVHVWFVAHPRQMQNWTGQAPNLYDISGSAHFINKADCGLVVHRNWKETSDTRVMLHVRKMRNKAAGRVGDAIMDYDRDVGTYNVLEVEAKQPPSKK